MLAVAELIDRERYKKDISRDEHIPLVNSSLDISFL